MHQIEERREGSLLEGVRKALSHIQDNFGHPLTISDYSWARGGRNVILVSTIGWYPLEGMEREITNAAAKAGFKVLSSRTEDLGDEDCRKIVPYVEIGPKGVNDGG